MKKNSGKIKINPKIISKRSKVTNAKKVVVSKKPFTEILDSISLNLEIINVSPIGTLIYNASSGQCIYANQAIAKITGGTIEQLCKLNFRKIKSWKKSGLLDNAEKTLNSSTLQIIECDAESTFGKHFWARVEFKSFVHDGEKFLLAHFTDISERKEAEIKLKTEHENLLIQTSNLQKSEANIRSVFDNSFTGFALMDTNFDVKLFNQIFENFIQKEFGTEIQSGKNILDFLTGYVNERLKVELPKTLKGNIFKIENNFTGISGKPHWYHIRLFPSYDDKKNIVGIILAVSDINERKKAEAELQTSEEIFRTVVQNGQNLTTLTDENDNLIFVSPQCEDVIGYSGEKFIGKKLPYHIHSDDAELCKIKWKSLVAKGENISHHEYRLIDKNGSIRWISHSAKRVMVDGKIKYLQSTIRNITDRKINEELLKESEYLLKTSQEVSRIGSYELDMKTLKWKATKQLSEILGIPFKVEYTHHDWMSIIHPDYVELSSEYLSGDLLKKNPSFNKEYKIINKKTGNEYWVSDVGKIRMDNGSIKMYGTMQDINERKRNEEMIIKKNEELERFNRTMVGREIKMIELKKEINELLKQQGKDEKYKIVK